MFANIGFYLFRNYCRVSHRLLKIIVRNVSIMNYWFSFCFVQLDQWYSMTQMWRSWLQVCNQFVYLRRLYIYNIRFTALIITLKLNINLRNSFARILYQFVCRPHVVGKIKLTIIETYLDTGPLKMMSSCSAVVNVLHEKGFTEILLVQYRKRVLFW